MTRRRPRREPEVRAAPAAIARWSWLLPVVVAALLAFAPADSNAAWALNGLRTVPAVRGALLLLVAAGAGAWAWDGRLPGAPLAIALAALLAFGLPEAGHFLGDTYVRWRLLEAAGSGIAPKDFDAVAHALHAQPLDNLLGGWGPLRLVHGGVPPALAVGIGSFTLALVFFAAVARLARRHAPEGGAAPLAAAMILSGQLEVFAGYAESGGVLLAFGAAWWVSLQRPLVRGRDGALAALAWLAFASAHRVALVALLPQLARALFVRFEGDTTAGRRGLLVATLAAAGLAAALSVAAAGGALVRDLTELAATLRRLTPAHDVLNLAVLVLPLALLAPLRTGAARLAGVFRSPSGVLHAVAFVPLLPLLLVYPMAAHGLGAHRDWELSVLPGFVATSFAGLGLARLGAAPRRAALTVLLPALVLLSGAWVLTNADADSSFRRARTLVRDPLGATGEARAHTLVYLGYRAADSGDDAASARWFDESFELLPNTRTSLLAAESWLRAGNTAAARASIARARRGGTLPGEFEGAARMLERYASWADSAAAARSER